MNWRMVWRILLALSVFIGLNMYVGCHGLLYLREGFGFGRDAWYWTVFWLAATAYFWSWLGRRVLPVSVMEAFKWIGSYYFAVLQYALLLLPFADIAGLLMGSAGASWTSRVVLPGTVVLLVLAMILGWGSWNAWNPVVRKYAVTIPKTAGGLKKLRIAAASDLHLGSIVRKNYLKKLVDRFRDMDPDLILLPGDILDDSIEPFLRQRMGDVMRKLRARYGVYAVLGNHEYFGGEVEAFIREMRACGIRVLTDEVLELANGITLIGRKDYAADRFERSGPGKLPLEELLQDVDRSKPLILLDHQPYGLDKAARAGIDLMLSGHTHRGQLAPIHRITRRLFELDWGYLQKGNLHAIVSSGYGSWGPPIRIGSRSEIVEVTVTFSGNSA